MEYLTNDQSEIDSYEAEFQPELLTTSEPGIAATAKPAAQDLAAQVMAGNGEAFVELSEQVIPGIRTTARNHGVATQDLDDAVQDILLKLWETLRKRTPDFANGANNYANQMTANRTIDNWRRKTRRPEEFLVDDYGDFNSALTTPAHESPEAIVVDGISSEIAVNALLALTKPERRDALRAVRINGYSQTEYAEQTGVPRGTALSRVHRGEDDIRNGLARQDTPPAE